jgi:quercetin dioxygenase-like cupin family protein
LSRVALISLLNSTSVPIIPAHPPADAQNCASIEGCAKAMLTMASNLKPLFPSDDQAEQIDIAKAAAQLRREDHGPTGRLTRVLITLPGLRVVLVSMKADAAWKEHSTPGRITVQPIAGHIRMCSAAGEFDLRPGNLAAFAGGFPHDVFAEEARMFLLTVARPNLD